MTDADPIVLSGGGITVHKSYQDAAYPEPAIVIIIEQFEPDATEVTVTESIPADADGALIEFDAETADHWTARDDELELTISLADGESIETAYAYAGGIADALEAWLTPPTVVIEFADGKTTTLEPGDAKPPKTVVHLPEEVTAADTDSAALGYGDGVAYEPPEPEAVESGDVYGQDAATPFEDHAETTPESLYGEIEPRWSEEASVIAARSSYGEADAHEPEEPEAVDDGDRYGDDDAVEDDEN
ncbi:hypothetical protein [Halonotius pteroides]|uniref:Uncharacterized protein n=1 Tax=Halonotius pteroides TaxID=268735 RepID=A0A3A6Q304_9EURY|nr:hypothetical protein [Halonotius pteroides]RJX50157.1 hypothetical protein DP106_06710 [Halonotius pteroides]